MLQNTCFSNIPAAKTGLYGCSFLAALLGLTPFCEPALKAATNMAYLQQPRQGVKPPFSYPIPPCGGTPLHAGFWGPFNLPGYGPVYVTLSGQVPALTWCNKVPFQQTDNTLYTWGADSNILNLQNNTALPMTYTLTFYFDGSAPPGPADLFLVVEGLGCSGPVCTTAQIINEVPASPPGNNLGEYTNKLSYSQTSFNPTPLPAFKAATPSRVTGWDLYQPNAAGLAMLQIQVTQIPGDNIGFTLGYKAGCSGLVGLTNPITVAIGDSTLYDIDATSGAATNPRRTGVDFSIAFSSDWSSGTLPVLDYNGLSTINLTTGLNGSQFALPPPFGGAGNLTADLTGTLYAIDGLGNLVEINAGIPKYMGSALNPAQTFYSTQSKLGKFVPDPPYVSPNPPRFGGVAFVQGNLWVIDVNNGYLLELNLSGAVINGYPLRLFGTNSRYVDTYGAAGLAYDPWTQTLYFTGGDNILYTLDWSGYLHKVTPLTGLPLEPGITALTFMVGVCH